MQTNFITEADRHSPASHTTEWIRVPALDGGCVGATLQPLGPTDPFIIAAEPPCRLGVHSTRSLGRVALENAAGTPVFALLRGPRPFSEVIGHFYGIEKQRVEIKFSRATEAVDKVSNVVGDPSSIYSQEPSRHGWALRLLLAWTSDPLRV